MTIKMLFDGAMTWQICAEIPVSWMWVVHYHCVPEAFVTQNTRWWKCTTESISWQMSIDGGPLAFWTLASSFPITRFSSIESYCISIFALDEESVHWSSILAWLVLSLQQHSTISWILTVQLRTCFISWSSNRWVTVIVNGTDHSKMSRTVLDRCYSMTEKVPWGTLVMDELAAFLGWWPAAMQGITSARTRGWLTRAPYCKKHRTLK